MKQFDNIRAHKPEGIEDSKAYIVGGGVAGLASAVFLIDDCYVPGENVTIYDQLPIMGGSMDGAKVGEDKYTCRGERELELTWSASGIWATKFPPCTRRAAPLPRKRWM